MKKIIKIAFYGFAKDFNLENYSILKPLFDKYDFQLSDNPEYIFYTPADNMHHNFEGIRIFVTGENVIPNFNYCDYALGFHKISFQDWRLFFHYRMWLFQT